MMIKSPTQDVGLFIWCAFSINNQYKAKDN